MHTRACRFWSTFGIGQMFVWPTAYLLWVISPSTEPMTFEMAIAVSSVLTMSIGTLIGLLRVLEFEPSKRVVIR